LPIASNKFCDSSSPSKCFISSINDWGKTIRLFYIIDTKVAIFFATLQLLFYLAASNEQRNK
jgi:hypothetical protein